MSLIHSPLPNHPISAIGVFNKGDEYESEATRKPFVVANSNMGIYFSCLFCLMNGRRDLLPLTWAWSRTSARMSIRFSFLRYDKPALREVQEVRWFFMDMVDTILTFRVPCVVVEDGEEVNMADFLQRVLSFLERSKQTEIPTDDLAAFLLSSIESTEAERRVFRQMSRFSTAGVTISATVFSALRAKPTDTLKVLRQGQQGIGSLFGIEYTHLPGLGMKAMIELKESNSIEEVWSALVKAVCHTDAEIKLNTVAHDESPYERRNRRAVSGFLPTIYESIRARCNKEKLEESLISSARLPIDNLKEAMDYAYEEQADFVPVTFMRSKGYDAFNESGKVKTFWDFVDEGSPASLWHSRYSDMPDRSRLITDSRLWGERGSDITYGALIHRSMKDVIANLANMYGEIMVEWNLKVLNFATLTANDSASAAFALPATKENVIKAVVPLCLARLESRSCRNPGRIPELVNALFGVETWMNFIEIQVHKRLTVDDARSASLVSA
jgi:hypothetical protein